MHLLSQHKKIQVQAFLGSCHTAGHAGPLMWSKMPARKPGRKPKAPAAWEYMNFDIRTPEVHPQQDRHLLLGLNQDTANNIANEPLSHNCKPTVIT